MKTQYYMARVHISGFHEAVQYPHEAIKGVRVENAPNKLYYSTHDCPRHIQDLVQTYLITKSPSRIFPRLYYTKHYVFREYA